MNKVFTLLLCNLVCVGIYSEASARFGLWEVRGLAGMSTTTVNQYSVEPSGEGFESLIMQTEQDYTGIPIGLRFTLASANEGPALNFNVFFQPVLADDGDVVYLVLPDVWGGGTINRSYWDVGGSAEITYRLAEPFRGFYFGAGVGLHRVTDKTTFTPPFYLTSDFPLPIDVLDNGDFRTGIHLLAGIPLHPRFAIEGRYEIINDFNQFKIGVSIGFWSYQ